MSEWIDQLAIDTALAGNRDGFSTGGANFRLYHDTALDKLRLVILGPDDTFLPESLPEPSFTAARARRAMPGPQPAVPGHLPGEARWRRPRASRSTSRRSASSAPASWPPRPIKQRVDALWAIIGDRAKNDPLRVRSRVTPR